MSGTIVDMNKNTWESHLSSRGNPVLTGNWGTTPWEFYSYDRLVPTSQVVVRTAMCVPVCSLNRKNPRVMLTIDPDRGGYEIPGGHVDTLKNGTVESTAVAAAREVREETGLDVPARLLIPFGYTEAQNSRNPKYPPITYMQFFAAYTSEDPGPIEDPEVNGAGTFALEALVRMAQRKLMKTSELEIIRLGVAAILRRHR